MLEVTQSFAIGRKRYLRGDLVDPKDPVVKGREHAFRQAKPKAERAKEQMEARREGARQRAKRVAESRRSQASGERRVEQATAAPGETRGIKLPKDEAKSQDSEPTPAKGGKVSCDECGKSFKGESGLATHKRAKHA